MADSLAWALFSKGIRFLLYYLDDYLFIVPPGSHKVTCIKEVVTIVFRDLGVPVAAHQTEGLSTQVTFPSFVLDTEAFQLRLPQEKLERMREMVHR